MGGMEECHLKVKFLWLLLTIYIFRNKSFFQIKIEQFFHVYDHKGMFLGYLPFKDHQDVQKCLAWNLLLL